MSPKRQFWTLFFSSFTGFSLAFIISPLTHQQPISIQELTTPSNTFVLKTDQTSLKLDDTVTITLNYSLNSPAHFAQALLEYDPAILKFLPPEEKLHPLPYHKLTQPIDNQIKITANSINPLNLILSKKTIDSPGSLANLKFQVINNSSPTTQIKFILPDNDQADWEKSNIVFLAKDLEINQLLTQNPLPLDLTILKPSPSPTSLPSSSPSPAPQSTPAASPPTSSPSAQLFNYLNDELFPTIASEASEIKQASPSSSSANLFTYLEATPEATSSTVSTALLTHPTATQSPLPTPQPSPSLIQQIITLINQIFHFLGSLTLNRS